MKKLMLTVAACSLFAFAAVSHASVPPQPPAGIKEMYAFLGNWSGTAEDVVPGQAPVKMRATFSCHKAAEGWGLSCEHAMIGKDMKATGAHVIGYNAETSRVHWYTVTNVGEVHDHVGKWSDAQDFDMRYVGQQGSKRLQEDIHISLKAPSHAIVTITTKLDGEKTDTTTIDLTRAAMKAPAGDEKKKG